MERSRLTSLSMFGMVYRARRGRYAKIIMTVQLLQLISTSPITEEMEVVEHLEEGLAGMERAQEVAYALTMVEEAVEEEVVVEETMKKP